MKTTTALLIAIGLASHPAWAQSQSVSPQGQSLQAPDSTTQPQAETPSSSGMSAAPDSSGASDTSSTSGTSGTQSGWQSGSQSSGSSGGMQSEAGMEFNNAPPAMSLPQEQTQNDVAYLCGGVGQEEASYMKQQARNYDLALTFATRTGAYLADVDVNIKNTKGDDVLQAKCDGPMLLVNLPKSGTYRIRAETSGYSLNRTAKVTASRNKTQRVARVALVWPNEAAGTGAPETASGSSGTESSGAGADDSSVWRNHRSPMHPRDEGNAR
jgi:hypothetical protein